ncbi:MAG: VOC family protein [Cognatishimia sp.]
MIKGAVLYAKTLENLRRFYLGLGGRLIEGVDGEFAAIATSDAELIILQTPERIASQIVIETPPEIRTAMPVKPIVNVASIEEVLQNLPDLGGMIVPGSSQWRFRQYLVQDIVDPEGNVIQLWQAV